MAAIDFPNTPTLDDLFSAGGKTWQWDGSSWRLIASTTVVTGGGEPSTTEVTGGSADTIQFYELSAVDAGGI